VRAVLAGDRRVTGGRSQNCAPYMGSGRGWLAGNWPLTGGVGVIPKVIIIFGSDGSDTIVPLRATEIINALTRKTDVEIERSHYHFYSATLCKRCTSYGNSVCLSVRLSVRHTPVLCQNDGT